MYLLQKVKEFEKMKFLDCFNASYDTNPALKRSDKKKKKVKILMFSILNIDNFFSIPRFEIKSLKLNHIANEDPKERQTNNIL